MQAKIKEQKKSSRDEKKKKIEKCKNTDRDGKNKYKELRNKKDTEQVKEEIIVGERV